MNWFQILVMVVAAVVLTLTLAALVRGWATRRDALVLTIFCIGAAVATAWPDQITVPIAHKLGIGRGADLVFYCAVVGMLIGFWMTYIRLRLLRRQLTLLVRQLALTQAHGEKPNKPNVH